VFFCSATALTEVIITLFLKVWKFTFRTASETSKNISRLEEEQFLIQILRDMDKEFGGGDNHKKPENGSVPVGHEDTSSVCESIQVRLKVTEPNNTESNTVAVKSISDNQMATPKNGNWLKRFIQKKSEGLSKRQVMICVIFAFVEFFAATVISIQAPFFPEVVSFIFLKMFSTFKIMN
jgi:hypothetical protein